MSNYRCEALALPMPVGYNTESPLEIVYRTVDSAFTYVDGLLQEYGILFVKGRNQQRGRRGDHGPSKARRRLGEAWIPRGKRNNPGRSVKEK